jgi:hypothetical protein
MLPGIDNWPPRQRNVSRYLFLHPAARQVFDDWDGRVRNCITLGFQCMRLEGTQGQRLYVHFAEPGSADHDAMVLLDMLAPKAALCR